MAASSTFSSLLRSPPALISDHLSPPPCRCSFSSSPVLPRSSRLGLTLPERRNLSLKSTVGEVSYRDPTTSGSGADERIESLKLKLLVFQRIDVFSKDFDNIAEVEIGAPWPFPPIEVTATLAHKFELLGTRKIKITLQKTTVKTSGNLSQIPPFDIPRLPDSFTPLSNSGTWGFEVTYVDENMRIGRGERGELRVFVRVVDM